MLFFFFFWLSNAQILKPLNFLKFFFSNLEFGHMGCVVNFKIGNMYIFFRKCGNLGNF